MKSSLLSDLIDTDRTQRWTRGCVFRSTRDEFGAFSNMKAGMPFYFGGIFWRSSEALYQAARFQSNPVLWNAINLQPNAYWSKQKAYEFIDMTRSDWDDVKLEIMLSVITLKYLTWSHKLWPLSRDYNHIIIECSKKDDFWGAKPDGSDLVGANVLGQLWTIVLNRGRSQHSNDIREDLLPRTQRTLDDVLKGNLTCQP